VVSGDTIAAIATAPGRGGVAVVRVSGPESLSIAERLTGKPASEAGRAVLRSIRSIGIDKHRPSVPIDTYRHLSIPTKPDRLIDEALVLVFRAPHSYTGEDVVEFQCHGGTVTPRRVLEACLKVGARLARRGEFTERAFLNGRLDYDQAEAVLDLVNARTDRAADAALEGLSGRGSRVYRDLYDAALDLSMQIEHALDIDEGELSAGFFDSLNSRLSTLNSQLETAIRRLREGKLLREGALVVLAGPPNAGKSSLLNALLEESRAIVSDVPGTTRDTIEEGLNLEGWPIRLVDTAGLRETGDVIEAEGVRRSEELIVKADVVVSLAGLEALAGLEGLDPARLLTIHPKCDLQRGAGLNVSAKTGEGLEDLKREIVARLEKLLDEVESEADLSADRLAALHAAHEALSTLNPQPSTLNFDLVLAGNAVRQAAERLGSLVGAVYSAEILDNLFSRFCIGK